MTADTGAPARGLAPRVLHHRLHHHLLVPGLVLLPEKGKSTLLPLEYNKNVVKINMKILIEYIIIQYIINLIYMHPYNNEQHYFPAKFYIYIFINNI